MTISVVDLPAPVPEFDFSDCLLCGSITDGGHVCPDLPMETCEPLPLLRADAGLPLLVDDLVEPLVQEDGEALTPVLRCGDIRGVVVGHLGDIIGEIGHTWMIRPDGSSRLASLYEQGREVALSALNSKATL